MDKKVLVIAPPQYLPGFQMAGVETVSPKAESEVETLVSKTLEDEGLGLVMVEESYEKVLSTRLRERAFDSTSPVVIFIPLGRTDAGSAEGYIAGIIRQAIGYSIKIREEA